MTVTSRNSSPTMCRRPDGWPTLPNRAMRRSRTRGGNRSMSWSSRAAAAREASDPRRKRVRPAEPGKPRVVAVRRDKGAVMFERYRGQVGILNQISATVCFRAEVPEERPVAGFGTNRLRRWRGEAGVDECLDGITWTWRFEDGGMRGDPQHGRKHRLEQRHGLRTVQSILQPGVIFGMTFALLAICDSGTRHTPAPPRRRVS